MKTTEDDKPIRMLLVEDDVESGEALRTILEKRGVEVRLFAEAEAALDGFSPEDFDILVSDIRLGGMSGVDLLDRVRRLKTDFPVILLTGYDSLETAIQAVRLGAQDYILKPLDTIDDLLVPARKAVENHRLRLHNARLEASLRKSEERWRSLVMNAPHAIAITDADGAISFVNRSFAGVTAEAAVGRVITDFLDEAHRTAAAAAIRRVFETGRSASCEVAGAREGGRRAWYEANVAPVTGEGHVVAVTIIATDITTRKKAKLALEASHMRLRALWSRYVEVEEREKKRLARELHDRIGQSLTALSINLNVLGSRLARHADLCVSERIDDSLEQVGKMAESLRDVMSDLRPPILDDYGLMPALRWYGEKFWRRTGVVVRFDGDADAPRLSSDVETALFRIAQEALNNVARHAEAKCVSIGLSREGKSVRMVVSDDGVGFEGIGEDGIGHGHGWGLTTMLERAEAVGASFRIEARPGGGTSVVVELTSGKGENEISGGSDV